ncbi:MAG TPA: ABC transporter ATP-binding protein [Nitrososphaera sp.]
MLKLAVNGLKVYYNTGEGSVKAVDGVNFEVINEESLGIVGESGCGKTTLGAAIMHSIQPPGKIVDGTIFLRGVDITKMQNSEFDRNIRWKKIAMVFQGAMNALDPVYTVENQIKEILEVHHFDGDMEKKLIDSLDQVGLDSSVAKRYPHELSGGMKQRVVIAMALLLEPDLLIADEPTTALDMLVQSQIINLLKKFRKEMGITIVMITHDLALVSHVTDKIGIMYAGQIVEVSSTREIFKKPLHPYTKALIEAMPTLRSNEKKVRYVKGIPPSLISPPKGCRFFSRCSYAMDVCKREPPEIKRGSGYVRCWLYDGNNEKPQL